jgi:hypothetical protein
MGLRSGMRNLENSGFWGKQAPDPGSRSEEEPDPVSAKLVTKMTFYVCPPGMLEQESNPNRTCQLTVQ